MLPPYNFETKLIAPEGIFQSIIEQNVCCWAMGQDVSTNLCCIYHNSSGGILFLDHTSGYTGLYEL